MEEDPDLWEFLTAAPAGSMHSSSSDSPHSQSESAQSVKSEGTIDREQTSAMGPAHLSDKYRASVTESIQRTLNCFTSTKRTGPPKKEYFRIMHIRSFLKSLRQIRTRKWPKRGLHALAVASPTSQEQWREYYRLFKAYSDAAQDCQCQPHVKQERSFNNSYCRQLLAHEGMRRLYFAFLQIVYANTSPEELCGKLKMQCCANASHTLLCTEKWKRVQYYAQYGMIEELGLAPWNGGAWGSPQWFEQEGNRPEQFLNIA